MDRTVTKLLDRLEMKVPQKLVLPVSLMFLSSSMATQMTVRDTSLLYEFDPRKFGIISEKAQSLLQEISHPETSADSDFSFTMD